MEYYDIGINLFNKQFKKPQDIINTAADEGVACVLTGTSLPSSKKVSEFILQQTNSTYGTVGIHPHNADNATKEDFGLMEEMLKNNSKLIAVGECGLDYDRMYSIKEKQLECLEKHIILAEKMNMPLFLHERSAVNDFISCLQNHKEICQKSVVHCFTGNQETLEKYLNMGFFIGITGWICDNRRGEELQKTVKIIPLDRILVETDAPYLTPKNIPGLSRVNVPENIKYVVKELANHMGVDEYILKRSCKNNTEQLFGIVSV